MSASLVRDEPKALDRLRANGGTLAAAVSTFWLVYLVDLVLGGSLLSYGIVPRTLDGLLGILFAPFLHANLAHLVFNSISFAVLGAITMTRRRADFFVVSAVGAIGSGLGVWLFGGAGTVVVGASGVIFAFLGFLMARAFFERSLPALVVSGLVIWLFHSMLWGILPLAIGVSWQAHLFGLLSGVGTAGALGRAMKVVRTP